MYFKDFDSWINVKKILNEEERKVFIRAGEVRWVSFGVNVGSEIDGKGVSFTRPALIIHVIGSNLALVIPMSTKLKDDTVGYIEFEFQNKKVSLCLHQARIVSHKRILSRKGKISGDRLKEVKDKIKEFYSL